MIGLCESQNVISIDPVEFLRINKNLVEDYISSIYRFIFQYIYLSLQDHYQSNSSELIESYKNIITYKLYKLIKMFHLFKFTKSSPEIILNLN
jgi:hypothetical protein